MTREEAKRRVECCRDFLANNYSDMGEPNFTALNMSIKALEQEPILDKIRAEIEKLKPNNPYFKGYFEQNVALNKALEVIDKYTAESEE